MVTLDGSTCNGGVCTQASIFKIKKFSGFMCSFDYLIVGWNERRTISCLFSKRQGEIQEVRKPCCAGEKELYVTTSRTIENSWWGCAAPFSKS